MSKIFLKVIVKSLLAILMIIGILKLFTSLW